MVETQQNGSSTSREASQDEQPPLHHHRASPNATSPVSTSSTHHERQTLLLMLLAQVCSLHDATPRTFVVHVLALFERGILDDNSVRFLFELGLVPGDVAERVDSGTESASRVNLDRSASNALQDYFSNSSALAIVPYCPSNQHPWYQYLPSSTSQTNGRQSSINEQLSNRRREAAVIRRHLERHESSANTNCSLHSNATNEVHSKEIKRSNSIATQNTFTSAEESFNATPNPNNLQLSNLQHPSPWSVEHHPLSLSRYTRDFLQISLLASGAFGSVYHSIHKLENKPYAVKCVTFRAEGYYASTLSLVIREVRCLAMLDHPNCVRYYTSWLEPSWMTGDQNLNNNYPEEGYTNENECNCKAESCPKLLEDIERVVNGCQEEEELEHKLEAILYGEDEKEDGFDWVDSKSFKRLSAFSFEQSDGNAAAADWGNLPSHQTNNPSVYSLSSGDANDSDVSEWTRDLNADSQSSHWDSKYSSAECTNRERTQSFHDVHSQMHGFERQESLELVKADQKPHRYGHKNENDKAKMRQPSSSPYKYQICLFIQMQLCHPMTLSDWIMQRNRSCLHFNAEEKQARARPAFLIFRQIVDGLEHVHSKGIIHRDLKPANIFAGDNGTWCIGDFGLSKMMRDAHPVPLSPSDEFFTSRNIANDGHTAGVGTASYAAPEQITETQYGPEVDIFALGMILLELFTNFTSEHERAKAFHNCRHRRELEPWMHRTYPEVSALVLACTQPERSRRPTAKDIQNAGVFRQRGNCTELFRAELTTLKGEIAKRDSVIDEQRELLRAKDKEIEELRQRLSEMDVSKRTDTNLAVL